MTPRVAVITPTYQHRAFIEACVRSVVQQTEPDWEMVVVDDGSTDGTADAAAAFSDPRIQVLRNEHRGLARLGEAYAQAVAVTTAPLIAVLEGDDTWPRDKLARQVPVFEDLGVVMSYGAANLIDVTGRSFARYDRHPKGASANNSPIGSIVAPLARTNFVVSPTVMIRRAALEQIGGFWQPPSIPWVDNPTWLRLALQGRFAHVSEPIGNWRRHAAQFTTSLAAELVDRRAYVAEILELAQARGASAVDQRALAALAHALPGRETTRVATTQGRMQLLAGEWGGARQTFGSMLVGGGGWKPTVLGITGLVLATSHLDMEWAFRATGRLSWPTGIR